MDLEIHKIKEIHPGVFWMLLDCPTSRFLSFILSDAYEFVWCHNHIVGDGSWEEYGLPLFQDKIPHDVLARRVVFDFIVPTERFKEILPHLDPSVHIIQLNKLPPYYLKPDKIKAKTWYKLLDECDWLFEFDIPGNDYGQISSPNEELLLGLLQNPAIDWNNLP